MNDFTKVPAKNVIEKTIKSLKKNGIDAILVENKEEARRETLKIIPKGAEVLTNTSVTLDETGIAEAINDSGEYDSVKKRLMSMNGATQGQEMRQIGSAPDYAIGSVHAVTEDGKAMIASGSGSQIPSYAYGASHVIWVIGVQKIVKDLDMGLRRIYEHSLPLENIRAQKVYGVGSSIRKLLIVNEENKPGRIKLIFLNEVIGY